MRFIPDYKLDIVSEEEFPTAIKQIEQELQKFVVCGNFKAFDNINIYYEYFLAENSKASIVIVHGLSEFTKKFYEFTYYCLKQGYNVFVFDQRCHGLSDKLTDRIDLLHVDSFNDYAKDLAMFIDEIVLKTEDKPVYLYAHSMGGAISTMYLEDCENKVEKVVFAAPMIEPIVGYVPAPIARVGVGIGRYFYGKKTKFMLTGKFKPDLKFKDSYNLSKSRLEYYHNMRVENPNYQSTPMTFGCIYNSLIVGRKLLKKRKINKIKTPILLFSAEKDTVVKNDKQYKFAEKCKTCKLVNLKDATHAILSSSNDILNETISLTFDFFES